MRIFGETPGGQKTCLHLHRAFPYFYVPYDDDLPRDPVEAGAFLRNLASCLDAAMDMAVRAAEGAGPAPGAGPDKTHPVDPHVGSRPNHRPKRRFVHDATLVRAKPFYGYHPEERLFARLRLYDPGTITRARAAMLSGGILNRIFQPYEAHVSFIMQVMIDFNLHGMGLARCSRVTFRAPIPRWPGLHRARVAARRAPRTAGAARPPPVELEYEDVPPSRTSEGNLGMVFVPGSGFGAEEAATLATPATPATSGGAIARDARATIGVAGVAASTGARAWSAKIWTARTVPREWTRVRLREDEPTESVDGSVDGARPRRVSSLGEDASPPPRSANVELEADALVDHLLNPLDVIRTPLASAPSDARLVQSLVPVWEEEEARAAAEGRPAPRAPAPPARTRTAAETVGAGPRDRRDARRRVEEAADRERAAGVTPGLTLADILREERGEDGVGKSRVRRGEKSRDGSAGETEVENGEEPPASLGDFGNRGIGTETGIWTSVPGDSLPPASRSLPSASLEDDASATPSRVDPLGSIPPGSEELFRVARAANHASLAVGAFGTASQTQTQTFPRSQSQSQTRLSAPPLLPGSAAEGVDRDAVVLSQAGAAASQRATQDDPLYGLLMDFAHHAESSDLRRASIAAVASAEVAREAEEARGLARAFAEDDDDPDDLDAFASATQREWDDLREVQVQGTAEEEETEDERRAEERAEARTASEPEPETERETDAPLETAAATGQRGARARSIRTSTSSKVCWICGEDCSRERREWSRDTGYAHKSCAERRREADATRRAVREAFFRRERSARKRRLSEALTPDSFAAEEEDEDETARPRSFPRSVSPGPPSPASTPRTCVRCGLALVGERGVRSEARGYYHKKCALAEGFNLPRRKSRRVSERATSEGIASPAPGEGIASPAPGEGIASPAPAPGEASSSGLRALRRRAPPPSAAELSATLDARGIPAVVHRTPFYGDPEDAPKKPAVVAGRVVRVPTSAVSDLAPFFNRDRDRDAESRLRDLARVAPAADDVVPEGSGSRSRLWALRPLRPPPRRADVESLLANVDKNDASARDPALRGFGPKGGTPKDANGTGTPKDAAPIHKPRVPESPFHPPPRLSLRGSTVADDVPAACRARGDDFVSSTPSSGARAATARLDAWLDSLADVEDEGGVQRAGGNRGQSGPAAIGLGEIDDAPDLEEVRRPSSPKYDEPDGYLDHLRWHGCEAHATPSDRRTRSDERARSDERTKSDERARSDKRTKSDERTKSDKWTPSNVQSRPRFAPRSGERRRSRKPPRGASQFTPPSLAGATTPDSESVGFKSQGDGCAAAAARGSDVPPLGLLCVEMIGGTRGNLLPDPKYDAALVVGLCFTDDGGETHTRVALALRTERNERTSKIAPEAETAPMERDANPPDAMDATAAAAGTPLEDEDAAAAADAAARVEEAWSWGVEDAVPGDVEVHAFDDELALIRGFIATVRALDPDVLVGFEMQGESLGWLAERAGALGVGLLREISRDERVPGAAERQDDEYGRLHASGIYVTGRIVLNLWRILRGELKLQSYTFESCAHAVLSRRVPRFPHRTLSRWARGGDGAPRNVLGAHQRWHAIRHVSERASMVARMLEQLDVVARTSEQARIFGIDFFSVVFRGSQYRVESMMLRLAHTQNYVAISPSKEQAARQPAMACLPLVMEPESKMYVDPVAVLDFQSLYPSMVIAYNLCFSTCLGRVPDDNELAEGGETAAWTNPRQLGCSTLALPPGLLPTLVGERKKKTDDDNDDDDDDAARPAADVRDAKATRPPGVLCTSSGAMFAPPSVRPGVLPRLLTEILDTRVMVKAALKAAPREARARRRALNARQFGLKLIANVTYGYTAAGYSGRMPMAELADAIVQCGRDTLERAIRTVNSNSRWNARVVYGDTDSLFVHMPGATAERAHRIGAEIAAAVTADNPAPVTLKLEKVYLPCVLQTKKRYVGHAFETPDQRWPTFDAKGIEVARRDNVPALVKLQRASLRLLFVNRDLSMVKTFLQRQLAKLMAGRLPIRDLMFAKETRLGTYSSAAGVVRPPAAIVAEQMMARDPRAEPKFGERVPYVVVQGEPGGRLVDMVVHPRRVVEAGGALRLNAKYYAEKVMVPALQRLFSLAGADVWSWYRELPPPPRPAAAKRMPLGAARFGVTHAGSATIDQYYLSRVCAVCGALTRASRVVCEACARTPGTAAATLAWRAAALERESVRVGAVCRGCGGGGGGVGCAGTDREGGENATGSGTGAGSLECDSLDCPAYFRRRKVDRELDAVRAHFEDFVRGIG